MNESIGIQPIHIRFFTNANVDSKQMLVRNMIYLPPKEEQDGSDSDSNTENNTAQKDSTFPYFTDQVRFSISKIIKLPREKQIEIFFNKERFKKFVGSSFTKDIDEQNENAEHNLRTMIHVFFPTVFPIHVNISETFSENIKNTLTEYPFESDNTNIYSLISDFMGKKNNYGYLNTDKQYTVTKITLINDIINDPIFNNLIQPSINFQNWRNETMKMYKERSNNLLTKIKTTIQNHHNTILSSLNDTNSDSFKDLEKIRNKNSAINREAGHPPRLLAPYFDILLKTNNTNISEIINVFIEFYKLNNAAPSDKPNYIPYSIKTLPGFNDLLENSIKYKIDDEVQNTILNMDNAINYVTKIKEKDTFTNYIEKKVAEKIKTFTQLDTFLKTISDFRSPKRSYSNKNLTTIFDETYTNIRTFMEFIEFLRKIVIEDKPKDKYLSNTVMIDKLKTGIMRVKTKENSNTKNENNDPLKQKTNFYYDCFVNFELIQGLLNDENIDLIKCPYRNDFLVTIYNDLKTSENKNPFLFYNNIPVFDMAKYTQKNRSKSNRKIKGGFVPRGKGTLSSLSLKSVNKKYTHKKRNKRYNKYSLRERNSV